MNDSDFIQYCEIHSQTERALFSPADIDRLLVLAGQNPVRNNGFASMSYQNIEDLLDNARSNL